MSGRSPAWGRLYLIFPTAGLLCAAAHSIVPAGLWRTAAAFGVIGVVLGLFALWLAGNRSALSRQGEPVALMFESQVRVVYVYLPVRPWRLTPPGRVALEDGPLPASPAPAPPLPALSSIDRQVVTRG